MQSIKSLPRAAAQANRVHRRTTELE